ncbi:hypothetical protein KSS87_009100, partial [Heliosperma pusillum]
FHRSWLVGSVLWLFSELRALTININNCFHKKQLLGATIKNKSRKISKLNWKVCASATHRFDVVVVGAGIIGLSIARELLQRTNLSVAVVDAKVPCSGATGAGQGYLWMAHKTPGTAVWDLALRSQELWQLLAHTLLDQGIDPLEALGWKKTGMHLYASLHPYPLSATIGCYCFYPLLGLRA